ncbi:MAG: FctA domain-containing protein, partial [Clostridiales bacterium]|nr:FctA domain-containing protein [Clostridiales bacterium]
VYQVNYYLSTKNQPILVYGGTVGDKITAGMSFAYWAAIIVEKDSSTGKLYVDKIEPAKADASKLLCKATTADGFVLLIHSSEYNSYNIKVNDEVRVDFDYKNTTGYSATKYGTVIFGADLSPKPAKDNTGKLTIVPGADTRDLIEVNLYDYGSNINEKYNSDNTFPGFQQDNGTSTVYSTATSNFGNNITSDLAAGKSGITNSGGAINVTVNHANSPISGAMQATLGSDGYPALANGTSLGYLFSNNKYAAKKNSKSINGLFQYHETTGAYTFNSRENHAQFNPENDTFTLYDQIISSNFIMYPFGNFLPFNDIVKTSTQVSTIDKSYFQTIAQSAQYKYECGRGAEYNTLSTALNTWIGKMDAKYSSGWGAAQALNEYFNANVGDKNFDFAGQPELKNQLTRLYSIDYDEPTDFFFGMEMKMNFVQPKGGLTGKDGKQPMVFYFTGDDDVWVYLDGKLFLDLSGIHRHVGGEIDFVKGEVRYYDLDVKTGDVTTTPSKTVPFSDLVGDLNTTGTFKDYSMHSFNFYYMERGAGSGVCRMNFNFPLLRKNSISVTKELSVDEQDKIDLLGNPDFRFQILKENGTDLFIGSNVSYDILDTSGNKIGTGLTDANGVFTLKANQTAVFSGIKEDAGRYFVRELLNPDEFEQYGQIFVNGDSVTTDTDTDIVVGSDTFTGVKSPIKDISSGSTAFHFNNQIEFRKLGSLQITKNLTLYAQTRAAPQFQFKVTLDDALLPVGTSYMVGGVSRTVTEAGIITLKPNETAVILNIIAGSKFTVQETAASSDGYTVSYTGDGLTQESDQNGSFVSGVIKIDTAVAVLVHNLEGGISVTIPGKKLLTNPDGAEHRFSFQLEQVTDSAGTVSTENGTKQTASATFPADGGAKEAAFAFSIDYPEKEMTSLPSVFYYKITEIAENTDQVQYDPAIYIVAVTVTKESGELQAAVTGLWKNGTQVQDVGAVPLFTNTLVSSLTIGKQVDGDSTSDLEFGFTVSLKRGDQPLNGNFSAKRFTGDGENNVQDITIQFDELGCAFLRLKHDERIEICGIPVGTQWTVAESDPQGYHPYCTINSGEESDSNTGSGNLSSSGDTVLFVNMPYYELAKTGGIGTMWYTIGGLLLITAAGLLLLYAKVKHREHDDLSEA